MVVRVDKQWYQQVQTTRSRIRLLTNLLPIDQNSPAGSRMNQSILREEHETKTRIEEETMGCESDPKWGVFGGLYKKKLCFTFALLDLQVTIGSFFRAVE